MTARRDGFVLAGLLGLVLLMFLPAALGRVSFYASDLEMLNYPFRCWFARWWHQGLFAWWCRDADCGFPLFAEGQAGALYPGTWLFGLVSPAWYAMTLDLLGHLWWAGVGTWFWTRCLGADRLGAAVAALTVTFGGTMVAHLAQLNVLNGLSWMPFAAWGYEVGLRRGTRGYLAAGVCLGMQALAGYPVVMLLTATLLLVRAVSARRWSAVGGWAIVLGCGGLLGAAQLLPTMELLPHSERAGTMPWERASAWRLRLEHVPLLFAVGARGTPSDGGPLPDLPWEWNCHLGRVGLLLLLVGAVAVPEARLWAGLALAAALFACGGPLYHLLWRLPGFDRYQGPARLLPLWTVAAAPVIALTLTRLRGREPPRRAIWPAAGGIVLAAIVAALLARPAGEQASAWGRPAAWLLAVGLLGVAALLLWRPPRRGFVPAVLILAVADLWLASGDFQPLTRPGYWSERDPLTAEVRRSGARVHAPFSAHRELGSPHNLRFGVASTSILSPLALRRTQELLVQVDTLGLAAAQGDAFAAVRAARLMDWLRIGYAPAAILARVRAGRPNQIIQRTNLLAPPAWVALSWYGLEGLGMKVTEVVPGILSIERALVETTDDGQGAGRVIDCRWHGPNRQAVEVEANGRPLLVVADNAYPGWQAWIAGRREPWLRTDYVLRGVVPPPGPQTVRWVFNPTSVRLGLFLSLGSLAGLAGFGLGSRRR